MFSTKPFSHNPEDTSIQLQEVPLHELGHELGSSTYGDSKVSHETRSEFLYSSKTPAAVSQSATSTMKLRRSNSWGEDDLPDPESVQPTRWVLTSKRVRLFWWTLRYFLTFAIIFVALLIPIVVFNADADIADDDTLEDIEAKQYKNLVYYLFLWLELSWVSYISFDVIGLALPYMFRFIAR
jgi:hypothetical protein